MGSCCIISFLANNTKSEFEAEDYPKEYLPFLSQGFVSFVGSPDEVPIVTLRDTGASQSLIIENKY